MKCNEIFLSAWSLALKKSTIISGVPGHGTLPSAQKKNENKSTKTTTTFIINAEFAVDMCGI